MHLLCDAIIENFTTSFPSSFPGFQRKQPYTNYHLIVVLVQVQLAHIKPALPQLISTCTSPCLTDRQWSRSDDGANKHAALRNVMHYPYSYKATTLTEKRRRPRGLTALPNYECCPTPFEANALFSLLTSLISVLRYSRCSMQGLAPGRSPTLPCRPRVSRALIMELNCLVL